MEKEILVSNLEVNITRLIEAIETTKKVDNQSAVVDAVKNIKTYEDSNVISAVNGVVNAIHDAKVIFPEISFEKESKAITDAIKETTSVLSKKEMSFSVNTDLKGIEKYLEAILKKKIPKTEVNVPEVDFSKLEKGFTELKKAIKDIKISGGGGGPDVVGIKGIDANGADIRINPATEAKQDEIVTAVESISSSGGIPANKVTDAYGFQAEAVTVTHNYYFYEDGNANWYIMRNIIADGVYDYAKGTGGYQSVFVDNTSAPSGSQTFDSYEAIFDNVGASSLAFDTDGNLKTSDTPFLQRVAQGDVIGYSIINKFGQNDTLNNATYEDVWDGGATYTYPANGNADITKIVSTSTADTMDVEAQGLDSTGALVVQTITLTGTTAVVLDTPLWRIFRMKNVGAVDNVGEVSAQNTALGIIYAIMQAGNNQTLMALYTIPLNCTGYLYQGTNNLSGVTRAVAASGRLTMRPFGGVFQLKKTFGVNSEGSSFIPLQSPLPGKIPALTDIRVSALGSANGVSLNTTFDILLIED